MEIEAGEYIRVDNGIILRYDFITKNNDEILLGQKGKAYSFEDEEELEDFIKLRIVKHSKNIIDLIEVGDFVNESLVISDTKNTRTETCDGEEHKCIIVSRSKDDVLGWKMIDFDIKDILTKEQYEQNSYKL